MEAEFFTSYAIKVYISAAWVNLTPDILVNPPPRWNRGIMGNSQIDRVGSPGYLSFTLNNSVSNSAVAMGYYSPGHTNCLTGWTTGLPIRLEFVYDGLTYYKFYGRIKPDGIIVAPGMYGSRSVEVIAHDYMAQAQFHELKLLTLQENKTIDQVMPYITGNMPIEPLATSYAVGINTFPTVFDTLKTRTLAIAEMIKLANSELSAIYAKGDQTGGETLVCEKQTTRATVSRATLTSAESLLLTTGGYFLLQTGGQLLIDDTQDAIFSDAHISEGSIIGYGKNLANRIEVITYPRKVDAAATTVLWALPQEFTIAAGATKSNYVCRYRDPAGGASYVNGRNMVSPVATTDYTAGSASGLTDKTAQLTVTATYGTEAVSYNLTNNDAATIYVTKLQARGKGIYIYDAVRIVYDNAASQATHGVHTLSIDMRYQNDPAVGEQFAITVLAREKNPDWTIDRARILANRDDITMYGFLELEPGTRAAFSETVTGIDRDFFIQGYEAELTDGKYVWWMPVLQWAGSSTGLWILGTSTLGANTTLG